MVGISDGALCVEALPSGEREQCQIPSRIRARCQMQTRIRGAGEAQIEIGEKHHLDWQFARDDFREL